MKSRPISPYCAEIRQLEERIEQLRVLDSEWKAKRAAMICSARKTHTFGQIARRFGLSPEGVRKICLHVVDDGASDRAI